MLSHLVQKRCARARGSVTGAAVLVAAVRGGSEGTGADRVDRSGNVRAVRSRFRFPGRIFPYARCVGVRVRGCASVAGMHCAWRCWCACRVRMTLPRWYVGALVSCPGAWRGYSGGWCGKGGTFRSVRLTGLAIRGAEANRVARYRSIFRGMMLTNLGWVLRVGASEQSIRAGEWLFFSWRRILSVPEIRGGEWEGKRGEL